MYNEFYKYLAASNISVKYKDESSISFENKEINYLFVYDKSDPFYIRLVLPRIIDVSDFNTDIHAMINDYNTKYKAIKLTIVNDSLWLSIEQFVYSKDKLADLFARMISILEIVFLNIKEDYLKHKK